MNNPVQNQPTDPKHLVGITLLIVVITSYAAKRIRSMIREALADWAIKRLKIALTQLAAPSDPPDTGDPNDPNHIPPW